MDKCIACGTCAEKCPAKTEDAYDEGLSKRKAIYVAYPQAVPLKYVIDADRCIYFKKGRCKACEKFCPTGAIQFDAQPEQVDINVGAVVLTAGMKAFDPVAFDHYQYAKLPNVVTSIEFERLLSAGGPTGGHVQRLSDGEAPRKIAWLQCVGSRDLNRCDNPYCSSVCCMYAIKEAVIAKEHMGSDFEPTIFFMDMRTHGKDFEKYYDRAKQQGVRFVRSKVHSITQADASGTLNLEYATEAGERLLESYDMVVLSVGMEPSVAARASAETLGLDLNAFRFVETDDLTPVSTSREGIFVAGVIQGCKDIPQSVMEASAAACCAGVSLSASRGSRTRTESFPEQTDVGGQEPRIGVFVCNCGVNIGGFADVPAIAEYARSLPGVAHVEENLFTCSQDTQDKMVEVIGEQRLNRIVVAACTPRTHEPLFQETLRNAGLNPYLFEMANIRNQCTWVHSDDKAVATEKARDLVRMAVARAALLESIPDLSVAVEKRALVIGGGVAGMTAAVQLADQGFEAVIVERSNRLGGSALDVAKTWSGRAVQPFVADLVSRVASNDRIEAMCHAEPVAASGFVGNFETTIRCDETTRTIRHGAVIVATGGQATTTEEYLYGQSDRVMRWHEIEADPERIRQADSVVFIQCVGSRDDQRPYCSRICCTTAVSQAIWVKACNPDAAVYILYRDIRTYGERELLYKKARQLGVIFIRYTLADKPQVRAVDDGLAVSVFEPVLQQRIEIAADYVNLATAIEPSAGETISELYKIPMNAERFFMEAHAKLRPVEFATDGIFMCGIAHYPKSLDESIAQAMAAASRAATVLSRPVIDVAPTVSQIDADACIGCGLCAEICPFGAIAMDEVEGKGLRARNIAASCKGCGLCAASCPQKAIDMLHFKDNQIDAAVCSVVV